MGRAADGTTTIAYNGPEAEKRLLNTIAENERYRSYGEVLREMLRAGLASMHPQYVHLLDAIRDEHRARVRGRQKKGAEKRGLTNIRKAHAANTIRQQPGKPDVNLGVDVVDKAIALNDKAGQSAEQQSSESAQQQPLKYRLSQAKSARRGKRGGQKRGGPS